MPTRLVEILKEWMGKHPGGQFAFSHNFENPSQPPLRPLTVDQARVQFFKTLRDSKWNVIRGFHVFRHSYASNLATKCVDQRIIDKHMGHQTEEMRQRYQHLAPEVCKRAVEAIAE
jgi:integrase